MQNRYAGDVGDFGKFGFLRNLFSSDKWIFGIVWYLFPDEEHTDDGRFIQYFGKTPFRECNPVLHDKLEQIVRTTRSVSAIERSGIFNNDTVYYSNYVDSFHEFPGQTRENKEKRSRYRQRWLQDAVTMLNKCNAVFLDPDNGLEVSSCSKLNLKKSGKYAYYSEVRELFQGKEVCIIYQHLNRNGTHEKQISDRMKDLRREINPSGKIFAIRYHPYSPRAFFVLCSKKSEREIGSSIKSFMDSPWRKHCENFIESYI